jgi:hypothetical protein
MRYSALLSCYLGQNFGTVKADPTDERVFHTRSHTYLVLFHHEKETVFLDFNGWFGHYNGKRWGFWEAKRDMITVYRFERLDNRLAA